MKNVISSFCHRACLAALLLTVSACGKSTSSEDRLVSVNDMTTEERLSAPANGENGQRLFLTCAVCHDAKADVGHRVGPNLWGVYGAPVARHGDFTYSSALRNSGIVWTDESLDAYLESPSTFVPRGRMAYAGEKDAANRRDLIEFLKSRQ